MTQSGVGFGNGGKDNRRAIAVLDGGAMNDHAEQQAKGIGENVPLAALDPLTCVKARYSAAFRGLDALAIDHARAWRGLPVLAKARRHHQASIDPRPGSPVALGIEIVLHR